MVHLTRFIQGITFIIIRMSTELKRSLRAFASNFPLHLSAGVAMYGAVSLAPAIDRAYFWIAFLSPPVRWSSIVVIIIHVAALVAYGFLILEQWIAAVVSITTASFLLSCFNKRFYIIAAILFAVGAILDILTVEIWMTTDSDSDIDDNPQVFTIPPALGVIASLMASMAVCMALVNWEKGDNTSAVGGAQKTGAIQVGQRAWIPSVISTALQPKYGQNGAASRTQSGSDAPV